MRNGNKTVKVSIDGVGVVSAVVIEGLRYVSTGDAARVINAGAPKRYVSRHWVREAYDRGELTGVEMPIQDRKEDSIKSHWTFASLQSVLWARDAIRKLERDGNTGGPGGLKYDLASLKRPPAKSVPTPTEITHIDLDPSEDEVMGDSPPAGVIDMDLDPSEGELMGGSPPEARSIDCITNLREDVAKIAHEEIQKFVAANSQPLKTQTLISPASARVMLMSLFGRIDADRRDVCDVMTDQDEAAARMIAFTSAFAAVYRPPDGKPMTEAAFGRAFLDFGRALGGK